MHKSPPSRVRIFSAPPRHDKLEKAVGVCYNYNIMTKTVRQYG